jgi:hypothetical protein
MDIDENGGALGEQAEVQIARAMAAGPRHVTDSARIVGIDALGKRMVLREGRNGFTCQPGNPEVLGRPASCSNEAARQWSADLAAHKAKPTNAEPGIIYMLAGATERNLSSPSDKTSSPITIGPQWIIIWPFDPKTSGIVGNAQRHWRVYHVGRHAIRSPPHYGESRRHADRTFGRSHAG